MKLRTRKTARIEPPLTEAILLRVPQVAYVADLQDMCEELQGMQATMTEQAADASRQVIAMSAAVNLLWWPVAQPRCRQPGHEARLRPPPARCMAAVEGGARGVPTAVDLSVSGLSANGAPWAASDVRLAANRRCGVGPEVACTIGFENDC